MKALDDTIKLIEGISFTLKDQFNSQEPCLWSLKQFANYNKLSAPKEKMLMQVKALFFKSPFSVKIQSLIKEPKEVLSPLQRYWE